MIALSDDHPRARTGGVLIAEIEALGRGVPVAIVAAANRLDLFLYGLAISRCAWRRRPSKVLQKSDATLAIEQARSVFDYAAHLSSQLKVENAPEN